MYCDKHEFATVHGQRCGLLHGHTPPCRASEVNASLAAQGFHRIGRIDSVGRRSLWLREEQGAIELRAGRDGDDACVRVTSADPLYRELAHVLGCARFAAECEQSDGMALEASFALDRHPASVHRIEIDETPPERDFEVTRLVTDPHEVAAVLSGGCGHIEAGYRLDDPKVKP
jgi:hypothetical protein